jgi:hypothetical protein
VTTTIVIPVAGQLFHHLEHLVDQLGVEGRGRLVEQHDPRVHGQCPGDRHPLLLAPGELVRSLVGMVGQPHPGQVLHRLRPCDRLGPAGHVNRRAGHVLQGALVGEQVEPLEHHADVRAELRELAGMPGVIATVAQLVPDLPSEHGEASSVDPLQPVEASQERGLARAGGPDDAADLAFPDGQVDPR